MGLSSAPRREVADDVFGGVGAVGVESDAATGVFGDLVLVDDPFEGAAVSEAIFEDLGRDAGEGEGGVDDQGALVFGRAHLVFEAVGEGAAGGDEEFEGVGPELLVVEVEAGEAGASGGGRPPRRT